MGRSRRTRRRKENFTMPEYPRQAPNAIYVHIPFCAKHCAYCDFNTYVEKAQAAIVGRTVAAIRRDIERTAAELRADFAPVPIQTVFFGGGTPTFLSGAQLAEILQTLQAHFAFAADAEISSEANPGSSDAEKFAAMRQAGFNRLSVGVQTFDDTLLVALDRFHTAGEAEAALRMAREAGFANLNLDLMFGLPKQTARHWRETLERALALGTEHLSLYALTLEAGTRFERLYAGGKLELPDEDAELAMYEQGAEILTAADYEHYEVSNFAKPGFRSRHNQVYWRNEAYLGFGPGSGFLSERAALKRERIPLRYAEKIENGADLSVESECLDKAGTLGETLMLGLRLRDGLPMQRIRDRFGIEPLDYFAPQIAQLSERGLLERQGDILRLTHNGLLLANDVLSEFLPE